MDRCARSQNSTGLEIQPCSSPQPTIGDGRETRQKRLVKHGGEIWESILCPMLSLITPIFYPLVSVLPLFSGPRRTKSFDAANFGNAVARPLVHAWARPIDRVPNTP